MAIYGKKYLIENNFTVHEGVLDTLVDKANDAIDTTDIIRDMVAKQKAEKAKKEEEKNKPPLMKGANKKEK